ncbi:MAG: hypothetical protein ABJI96_16540 [Paracoccaceae bacterium]
MSQFELTDPRIMQGVWEGTLTPTAGHSGPPEVLVTHLDQTIDAVEITEGTDGLHWLLRVQIPIDVISDGMQTFVITNAESGDRLGQFHLVAGEPLRDDFRAEVDLLRAELDMLKRAFRRHCLETK